MAQVKIYSTPDCPWCIMSKQFFNEKGIEYQEYDASANEVARNEMLKKTGKLSVPVFEINGTIIDGFDVNSMNRALDYG